MQIPEGKRGRGHPEVRQGHQGDPKDTQVTLRCPLTCVDGVEDDTGVGADELVQQLHVLEREKRGKKQRKRGGKWGKKEMKWVKKERKRDGK